MCTEVWDIPASQIEAENLIVNELLRRFRKIRVVSTDHDLFITGVNMTISHYRQCETFRVPKDQMSYSIRAYKNCGQLDGIQV